MRSKLKQELSKQDLTYDELSKMTGVAKSTLHGIANGKHRPRLDVAFKVCKALNVDIYSFFDCEKYRSTFYV